MTSASWKSLFTPYTPGGQALEVRVFTRGGHPLLIIPRQPGLRARSALSLYAPQTALARLASLIWRWSLPLGFAPGSHTDRADINPTLPFVRFLTSLGDGNPAVESSKQLPPFVILAGNPHAPAPRFLVQIFDAAKRPVAVVKTGIGPAAAELITREASFLESTGLEPGERRLLAMPAVLGRFSHDQISAFAMRFVEGNSPRPAQAENIGLILDSWVDRKRRLRVDGLPAWQRLTQACSANERFKRLNQSLSSLELHPALFHGDFVPWNIKVSPNRDWTVLDWERGERQGPPGWDWFHYTIQSALLVEKKTDLALARVAESILPDDRFKTYCATVGLVGHERDWLRAYLFHCRDVLRPKEHATEMTRIYDQLIELV